MNQRARTPTESRVEWPTIGLLIGFAVAWTAVIVAHRSLPWFASVALLALLGGFHMSLQHELLHGHPTRWTRLNTALGFVPLPLYLPYVRYKDCHIAHHVNELTHPLVDPESFYLMPDSWTEAGPARRRLLLANRTLAGRLTVGTVYAIVAFLVTEVRLAAANRRIASVWALHLAGTAGLAWLVFGVAGQPVWEYVVGFVAMGSSLTQLRAFAEHRAVDGTTRSAVVNAGPAMSLLYLNNNLHHTHHSVPRAAWYELPALHEQLGADAAAEAGAGRYAGGYREVVRRHLFRPFCQPVHPLIGDQYVPSRGSGADA